MSTNSFAQSTLELTDFGETLSTYLRVVAHKSGMRSDVLLEANGQSLFVMTKVKGLLEGHTIVTTLGLPYCKPADAFYVSDFRVRYRVQEFFRSMTLGITICPDGSKLMNGVKVLDHFGKRIAHSHEYPQSDVWRITSPSNIEALLREYVSLAKFYDSQPLFDL